MEPDNESGGNPATGVGGSEKSFSLISGWIAGLVALELTALESLLSRTSWVITPDREPIAGGPCDLLSYLHIGPFPEWRGRGASFSLSQLSSEQSLSEPLSTLDPGVPFIGRTILRVRAERRLFPAPNLDSPPDAAPDMSDSLSVPAFNEE